MSLHKKVNEERFKPISSAEQDIIIKNLTDAINNNDEIGKRIIRDELIERHLRLIIMIGRGYEHKLDPDEIFAIGAVALTEAMNRWKPGGMSAYQWAKRWITTALNKAIDSNRHIRIPEQVAYKAALATKAVKEKENEIGRPLTDDEIFEVTEGNKRLEDLPIADLILSENNNNFDVEKNNNYIIESMLVDTAPIAEEIVEKNDLARNVREALECLTPDEKIVIEHRFGLNDKDGKTLAELGKILGTSGEAVRRLEASALAKLQHPANPIGVNKIL